MCTQAQLDPLTPLTKGMRVMVALPGAVRGKTTQKRWAWGTITKLLPRGAVQVDTGTQTLSVLATEIRGLAEEKCTIQEKCP